MEDRTLIEKIVIVLGLVVGATGAIGQAMILHNMLVHSYPYKMMGMPPADFYAKIGAVGGYLAPMVGIVVALLLRRVRPYLIPTLPVVVCPLLYWLVFEIMTLGGPYQGELLIESNFDHTTGRAAQFEFGYNALLLLFWGAALGLAVGAILIIASNTVSRITKKNRNTFE